MEVQRPPKSHENLRTKLEDLASLLDIRLRVTAKSQNTDIGERMEDRSIEQNKV